MIFKDRKEAGDLLAKKIFSDAHLCNYIHEKRGVFLVSLLRGGSIVGDEIAKQLKIKHLLLASVKIVSPFNLELAIGAICFNFTHIDNSTITLLRIDERRVKEQVAKAQKKFADYCDRFHIKEKTFEKISGGVVLLVDDGVATGSTIQSAYMFLKNKGPSKMILAVPTAPVEYKKAGFDKIVVLDEDPIRSSVSQAYKNFPQVEDNEIKSAETIR